MLSNLPFLILFLLPSFFHIAYVAEFVQVDKPENLAFVESYVLAPQNNFRERAGMGAQTRPGSLNQSNAPIGIP